MLQDNPLSGALFLAAIGHCTRFDVWVVLVKGIAAKAFNNLVQMHTHPTGYQRLHRPS